MTLKKKLQGSPEKQKVTLYLVKPDLLQVMAINHDSTKSGCEISFKKNTSGETVLDWLRVNPGEVNYWWEI